jgi:hypothetical protein
MTADYATLIVDDWRVSATRILAVIAALAVCGWFAISLRETIDTDAAGAIIYGATVPTPAQAQHARSLLSSASPLNPDPELKLMRSALAFELGDDARARQLALSVAVQEPLNVQAWIAYGRAAAGDPRAFAIALAHVRELAPAITPPH